MINFFTNMYSADIEKGFRFLKILRFNSLLRFSVRITANIVLPLYFLISKSRSVGVNPKNNLIVSLTTFPARVDRIWIVVETLLRQSTRPGRIILWLSKDQFSGPEVLPKRLVEQKARGLEIVFCEGDLRSHKKYYYTVKEFPESPFVIVDDDVFYPPNLLEKLSFYSDKYPGTVCFNRGYQVGISGNGFSEYVSWKFLSESSGPREDIMPTGVGGVLYPPHVLHPDVICDNIFLKYCKYADDIWLYAMTLYANNSLVKTDENRLFVPVLNKESPTLTEVNVVGGGNDVQLSELDYFYKKKVGVNIFNPPHSRGR
ncbi:MAG: hypothetical protein ACQEXC_16515 [Pseudomonadota bacterium]